MANPAEQKSATVLPAKSARFERAGDTASFENSFTAKDRHDLLEAAFKNWPLDTDPDVVPVLPIPHSAPGTAPTDPAEQAATWWNWAKANLFRKSTILKSALALLIAVILGWVPVLRLLATTSVEAIINARVINVRTPIAGEVSSQAAGLEIGKEFHAGDELLTVRNPRSDDVHLGDLKQHKEQLMTTIAVLQAKKQVLESHHRDLMVQKERYRTSRIEQLEKRITEIKTQIASAEFSARDCRKGSSACPRIIGQGRGL